MALDREIQLRCPDCGSCAFEEAAEGDREWEGEEALHETRKCLACGAKFGTLSKLLLVSIYRIK